MKSVDFRDRLWSIETRNKFGNPNGLGFMTLGASFLGDDNEMAGIYQRRKRSKYVIAGYDELGYAQYKHRGYNMTNELICRLRHYVPSNPRTEAQQTWRQYFATVLQAWQNLTPEEKKSWNQRAYPPNMTGWNRFASLHLKMRDI